MASLDEEIKDLLSVTITLSVFLIVFVELFFKRFATEPKTEIFYYSAVVAMYVASYAFFSLSRSQFEDPKIGSTVKRVLIYHLLLAALFICLNVGIEKWGIMPAFISQPVSGLNLTVMAIVLLALPIAIFFTFLGICLHYWFNKLPNKGEKVKKLKLEEMGTKALELTYTDSRHTAFAAYGIAVGLFVGGTTILDTQNEIGKLLIFGSLMIGLAGLVLYDRPADRCKKLLLTSYPKNQTRSKTAKK